MAKSKAPANPAPKVKGYAGTASDWALGVKYGRWVRVVSSNVARIKYDRVREVLHVEFKGSTPTEYVYIGVPLTVAKAMFNAPSMGKFVHRRLKGKYPYRRVG